MAPFALPTLAVDLAVDLTEGRRRFGGHSAAQLNGILKALPTRRAPGAAGTSSTAPCSPLVLTDDGRVAVGAVAPDQLYAAPWRRSDPTHSRP